MPTFPLHRLRRSHVLKAMRDIRNGKTGDFGDSKDYDLVFEGRPYPPKMVIGLAARYLPEWRRMLSSHDFHGGTRSVFIKRLSVLGFRINAKGDWTPGQNRAAIRAYVRMLRSELQAQRYIKRHKISYVAEVTMRSPKAIEYKFQNISAILKNLGYGWLNGYSPKNNYQHGLEIDVKALILSDKYLKATLRSLRKATVDRGDQRRSLSSKSIGLEAKFEEPPRFKKRKRTSVIPIVGSNSRKDYKKLTEEQRKLGLAGELYVFDLLKKIARKNHSPILERRIEHTSRVIGDHTGYDIKAFDERENPIYIEVKTTKRGKNTPFVISRNQLAVANANPKQFWVYRVFNWGNKPRIYKLKLTGRNAPPMRPETFLAGVGDS